MKTVHLPLDGHDYYLHCSSEAYFDIIERVGAEFIADCVPNSKAGIQNLSEAVATLCEAGEQARRVKGYPPGEIPTADVIRLAMTPTVRVSVFKAFRAALDIGFGRTVTPDENDEVDLVLLENQKKTAIP